MLEMGDRVEIVTKLLRESYLDYPQLCECYGALSAEALWKELEEARMQWRLNETLLGKSGYLCMTPYVLQRRCELLALLNQLQLSYPRVKGMTMEVVSLRLQAIDLDAYPLLTAAYAARGSAASFVLSFAAATGRPHSVSAVEGSGPAGGTAKGNGAFHG